MSRLPVDQLDTLTTQLELGKAAVYHLPDWHKLSHPQRLKVIRDIAERRGRDPRIARVAVEIIKKKGRPRQYSRQAAALLKWVQDPQNIYYVNEPGERLQDPIYTLKAGHGDCDDQILALCALFESIRLPWKLVLSGRGPQGKVRYIEGQPVPPGVSWSHIYCMVGAPPFNPTEWWFCEPTIEGVPLGWDIMSGDKAYLPELEPIHRGAPRINPAPPAPSWGFKPSPVSNPSPAYQEAMGSALLPLAVGIGVADEMESGTFNTKRVLQGIATGIAVAVGTQLVLGALVHSFPAVRRFVFWKSDVSR